ncbi:hypothetical protein MLD38_025968 [Melastoma candidum]|uniref:Uncharacterized protein n=1 Tax=Melastoma candidum TaxID=119954 RepID=A0ACB9NX45_9MYRT|nr:hypothetical protein MLD38_025968 [Melastoma candidum]
MFDPDELLGATVEKMGDQNATTKGNTAVLFVASAIDEQWPTSEKTLRVMLDSIPVREIIRSFFNSGVNFMESTEWMQSPDSKQKLSKNTALLFLAEFLKGTLSFRLK